MDAPAPGGLGGTYAGNPLAVASALAVLDVLESEKLIERGAALGRRLQDKLEGLKSRVTAIGEVRGLGAMIAVEFRKADGSPNPEFTRQVQDHALEKGLLLLTCGVHGNVIRFLFPLTIQDAVMDEGLGILEAALLQ
jgi:4-aminobutyrate aminotransferase/4-aminobutyrate aminotransferase/(S)-3-amino-2-methylpropionate transaminase